MAERITVTKKAIQLMRAASLADGHIPGFPIPPSHATSIELSEESMAFLRTEQARTGESLSNIIIRLCEDYLKQKEQKA